MQGEARLRGLRRIIYSKTISLMEAATLSAASINVF